VHGSTSLEHERCRGRCDCGCCRLLSLGNGQGSCVFVRGWNRPAGWNSFALKLIAFTTGCAHSDIRDCLGFVSPPRGSASPFVFLSLCFLFSLESRAEDSAPKLASCRRPSRVPSLPSVMVTNRPPPHSTFYHATGRIELAPGLALFLAFVKR
jgi:hypothetical protein